MSWYGAMGRPEPEPDDDLRARLLYLVDGDRNRDEIARASGEKLEDIASRYNLKRRWA